MQERTEWLTYLAGAADIAPERASPRVGDTVELRPGRGGKEIEAYSAAGLCLGRLPPQERDLIAGLFEDGRASLPARIDAVIPRPRLAGSGRIHLRVPAI